MTEKYLLHRIANWHPTASSQRVFWTLVLWAVCGVWAFVWEAGLIQDTGERGDRNHAAGLPIAGCVVFGIAAVILTLVTLWYWEQSKIDAPAKARKRIEDLEREAGIIP